MEAIDGFPIRLAGKDWILAPLNFLQIRKTLKQAFTDLRSEDPDLRFDAFFKVIQGSLVQNHPDITIEQIESMTNPGNVMAIVETIMEASGMVKLTPGGASEPDPSPGTTSTATSLPASPDGPGSTSTST